MSICKGSYMSNTVFNPMPTNTIDVKAMVKQLGLPVIKVINTDTPWWTVNTIDEKTYLIPAQPILYGVNHKTLSEKAFGQEIVIDDVKYNFVELPAETVKDWLSHPERLNAPSSPISSLGRLCWMGHGEPYRNQSYKRVLNIDTGEVDTIFHLTHVSRIGWLPVLLAKGNTSTESTPEEAPQVVPQGKTLPLSDKLRYELILSYGDSSQLIYTGGYDTITQVLKDPKIRDQLTHVECKITSARQPYSNQLTIEEFFKGD